VPLLSVVVPVYRVEDYLRQCLDSILDQGRDDLEVIVVDDCSPDGSGKIVDEYAARDSRVRAVHLTKNVGLGLARNAGFAQATGDYVWFVDSDDWLAEGAIAAVANRLTAERGAGRELDMLVVDFAHYYEKEERSRRSAAARVPARVPGPEVFTAIERPSVIGLLHVAWNRVVRRQFLIDHELHFHPGLYEDVSWTYPALIAAQRIAFLDRVCVYYRQREGAITKTGGERHLEMIHHWERVLEPLPADHPLRTPLFEQSMRHCLVVVGNDTRVPNRRLRREFFFRLAAYYRRFAPPGWAPSGGRAQRIRTWLVAKRLYPVYASLRMASRAKRWLRPGADRVVTSVSRG
jgi:CDP-glycerol glycerophosphotransferase